MFRRIFVWESIGQDGDSAGVFGRIFGKDGTPAGGEFAVNTYTTGAQSNAKVAVDDAGNFVVVWESANQDGSAGGIFGRRFDGGGAPLGPEFQVNTFTAGGQIYPAVAMTGAGSFLVAWTSGQDGSGTGIFGQRFLADGTPDGSEFQVNTYTTGPQYNVQVAMDASGGFVVVWESSGQDGSGEGIFGQRYDGSGTPQGGEFPVNTFTTGAQLFPNLGRNGAGEFVVVWMSYQQDGDDYGLFGRRFGSDGVGQGPDFQVNSYTSGYQGSAKVVVDDSGRFVVAWNSSLQDGSSYGVFGRHFGADGSPLGGEFSVNTYTTDGQVRPMIAQDATGEFVVVWESGSQDGDGKGIFGRRFAVESCSPDVDGDGVLNAVDNCPTICNPFQEDVGNPGVANNHIGDACDGPGDREYYYGVVIAAGANSVLDSVPAADDVAAPGCNVIWAGDDGVAQTIAVGDDVQVMAVGESSECAGDTIPDQVDNCPAVCNVDQADGNGDLIGDACCPGVVLTANEYCISGESTGLSYAWGIDNDGNGQIDGTDPQNQSARTSASYCYSAWCWWAREWCSCCGATVGSRR